jgi:hypothetical protein
MRRNLTISFEEAYINHLDNARGTISRGRWIEGERPERDTTSEGGGITHIEGPPSANAFGAIITTENDNLRTALAQRSPLAETLGEVDEHTIVETRVPSVSPKLSGGIKPRPKGEKK